MGGMRRTLNSMRAIVVVAILAGLLAAAAQGALVKVGLLVLRAEGSFSPKTLPKKRFAPIDFQGHAEISSQDGSVPPALTHAELDFDRNGRLSTQGLPQCPPSRIESATPLQARSLCKGAIVGEGTVSGLIKLPQGPVPASSPLTIFNGPPQGNDPTVILHAQLTTPATQTFAIVVPISRTPGPYGYRATIDLPPIAGGLGSLTRISAKIGRRYVSGGVQRSYTSARCADSILAVHGHFEFADGTVIDGTVQKFCRTE
jgi:hypothetical protein